MIANNARKQQKLFVQGYNLEVHDEIKYTRKHRAIDSILVNRLRNNIFVNPPPLPLLCEISGAVHLVQPGLMAGWLAEEIQVNQLRNFQSWL